MYKWVLFPMGDIEWAWKVLGHWVAQAHTPQCQFHGKTKASLVVYSP